MSSDGRLAMGQQIRVQVLGAEHVQRSLDNATEFGGPLQQLVTEYCWGTVWARTGLDRRTRSLLNIAMLAALNHHSELALHVRGALTNGCTPVEIQETILQVAIYCGVPAALAASRTAQVVLDAAALDDSVGDVVDGDGFQPDEG